MGDQLLPRQGRTGQNRGVKDKLPGGVWTKRKGRCKSSQAAPVAAATDPVAVVIVWGVLWFNEEEDGGEEKARPCSVFTGEFEDNMRGE